MSWIARLNKPWLHFLFLGVVLYQLQGWAFPEPKPVIGPLSDARLEALQQQWSAAVGRPPSSEQLIQMVGSELDRDMLFQRALELNLHLYDTVVYQRLIRNMNFLQMAEGKSDQQLYEEALEMRLHLGDEVVKRRLIQIMEQLLLAKNPPQTPTVIAVEAEFIARREELRRPARYTIEHLYFSRDRADDVDSVVATIHAEKLTAQEARKLSSPFLPGYLFRSQTPDQLGRHFGAAFVANFLAQEPQTGHWLGPIRSTYGLHYVWVDEIVAERDAQLAEVEAQIKRDLESKARLEALAASITQLRSDYEVRYE